VASGRSFAALIQWRLTPLVLIASLLFAFFFGAVHALGPGHGKTITAAYLVGARAKRQQAMTIGAAVSVMHTGSVLALGLVAYVLLKTFPADRVYPWLTLVTGLVALGLGLGLMVARVRARRRGADPWHGHTHPWDDPAGAAGLAVAGAAATVAFAAEGGSAGSGSAVMVLERAPHLESHQHHDHDGHRDAHLDLEDGHEADHHHHAGAREPIEPVSSRGLLALAVAGGILPSPTAFVVLTGAIRYHRLGYGLGLIAAFSVGLAAALIAVGTVALRAQSFMNRRVGWRVSSLIPILSAGVIVGFGAFFAARGLHSGFDGALALAVTVGILAGTAGAVLSARGSRPSAAA
jgi:ABC-type nickel/cobalt efflux system permease component RcnA